MPRSRTGEIANRVNIHQGAYALILLGAVHIGIGGAIDKMSELPAGHKRIDSRGIGDVEAVGVGKNKFGVR